MAEGMESTAAPFDQALNPLPNVSLPEPVYVTRGPDRVSPLDSVSQALDGQLSVSHELMSILSDRLGPVLTPAVDTPESADKREYAGQAPAVHALEQLHDVQLRLNARIKELIDRLEI